MTETWIQAHDFDGDQSAMKCVWMLAGVVDYKLCDHQYDCDRCPFDTAICDGAHARGGLGQTAQGAVSGRINIQGYELMPLLFYHPCHLWARIENEGSVRIGFDDFGQRLVGRIYAIELPEPGTEVRRGDLCWRIAHHAGETAVPAPVSGLVLQVNSKLYQHPSLINRDPYGKGWVFVIQPAHLDQSLKQLYYGFNVEQWYERDIERLHLEMRDLLGSALPGVGVTMQDGGSRILDFTNLLTADEMRQMIDSFMSAPVIDRSAAPVAEVTGTDQGR